MASANPFHVINGTARSETVIIRHPKVFLFMLLTLIYGSAFTPATALSANEKTAVPVQYMIIITGGELLSGVYADSHTYYLTRSLRPLGLQCVGSMSVDDKQANIKEALDYASGKVRLIIITGGLGPTVNDITRETLSDYTGIDLKEHPGALKDIARRFGLPPAQLPPNIRKQIQVPIKGT